MRVIIYARVSTEEQAREGVSIENQVEKMKSYCAIYGHEVVETVVDLGLSAKSVNREGMQKIIEMTGKRRPGIEGIVVYKLDRAFRCCEEALRYSALWDKRGIALISVQEQLDTKSASGRLFFTLLAAMAEWERMTIGERTASALNFKKNRGEKTGGYVPYGFDMEIKDGVKMLVPNDSEQKTLKRIQRMSNAGQSLREIAGALNEQGISTKSGKSRWHPEVIRGILTQ